jgi:phosphomannomutase/phosphoglucomutase
MNPKIFREYDIRGVVGEDFEVKEAETVGRGYGTYLKSKGVETAVVGRDCRLSSPEVRDYLTAGLTATGLNVIDVGVCPTSVLYFALFHLTPGGGVMITASHNPPEYNGFKLCLDKSTIFGDEIQTVGNVIQGGDFAKGNGTVKEYDILTPYHDFLKSNIKLRRPVKFAADGGNGTAGPVAGPIFNALGSPAVELYFDMDGTFPNHEPDPTVPENMVDLAKVVQDQGLELGLGFDGDSDRVGVVDENGRIIYGDMVTLIFAREILKEHPNASVVAEVKCSQNLFNDIKKRGGRAVMWKAGHSLIKNKMKQEKALLAGEMSGHIFFGHRFFGFDDGIYAGLRLLEIVSQRDEPVSQFLSDLPIMYNTEEIRVDCPEEIKFKVVERVKQMLADQYQVIDIDGVRVVFPDGWGLLRASNTGPILVLRFEAESPERLDAIRNLVEETLEKAKSQV